MNGGRAVLLSEKDGWIHTFWRRHWLVLGMFVVTLMADALTTVDFMIKDGVECELNPFVLGCAKLLGPVLGPLAAAMHKGWSAVLIGLYYEKYAHYLFASAAGIYLFAACYNIWAIELFTRGVIGTRWLLF
ncbi:MAG: hypothetical protein B6I25_02305 [Planctomycetales bacterium 4572_13]|nr:MAG: hypothetical protein B6I25_02305 [Planctomycetales bacterium 4572_13]